MRARPLVATAAALTIASAALAGTTGSAGASEKADPEVTTLAKRLVSPLSLAVDSDGDRYIAQNFTGLLMRQAAAGGAPQVIYQGKKGAEVGAVSVQEGVVTFAVSEGNNAKGTIYQMGLDDVVRKIGRIHPVEKQENPDGKVRYGFRHLKPSCAKRVPRFIPAAYTGVPETHPFATTSVGDTVYVADAGANAVYRIDPEGEVSPVAVIPPHRAVITRAGAKANKLPACTIGKAYYFESVPTDVEYGPDGKLYVSSLAGGPEDGSLGATGAVFSVNPSTGKVRKVVGGLVSAKDLAVAANGDIYVAELFRGRIARIKHGKHKVRTFIELPLPATVEIGPDGVYATVNALTGLEPGSKPRGKLIRITS